MNLPRTLGHYRLEGELGRGGMGVVYLASDATLGRSVALKLLPEERAASPAFLARLKREARAIASLNHPGVVTLYSLEEAQGQRFLTMEYVEGAPLQIPACGLAPDGWLDLAAQLCAAVGAAHRAGIVHRDLKPQNVLVTRDGRIKVCDFGLAKPTQLGAIDSSSSSEAETSHSVVHALIGTLPYMSPEQTRGDPLGTSSDVFSLGILLWEMAVGRRPFEGPDRSSVIAAILRDQPPPLTAVRPDFDPHISRLVARCLAKEPTARFPSAQELHAELTRLSRRRDGASEADSQGPADGSLAAATQAGASTLPVESRRLVARERELEALGGMLAGAAQPVTLLGPGGMGKTRLAVRYAWAHLGAWSGGNWFCDLSDARTLDGLLDAVARGLDVHLGQGDLVTRIGEVIANRSPCLVVLDNFEQVAQHAAATIGCWLRRAPDARWLVTSRVRLGLESEQIFELPPLTLMAAIEVFALRAKELRSSFELTDRNRQDVQAVVELLDGVPLAIELAAARVRILTPAQIRRRLDDRFRLLQDSARPVERQATMRAAIDWSWNLLAPWEQAALAQSAVFRGGMTIEAAEAVIDLSPWPDAPPVLDVVQSLVDSSMLRLVESGVSVDEEGLYFGMYASIQAYAEEKLRTRAGDADASGPEAERAAHARHGAYYAQLGSDASIQALVRDGGRERMRCLGRELDNLMAAFDRGLQRGDPVAVGAHHAAWEVFNQRGPTRLAVELPRRLLARPECLDAGQTLRTQELLARALLRHGDRVEAEELHQSLLGRYRALGGREGQLGQGRSASSLGLLYMEQGRVEDARECYREALACSRVTGDQRTEALTLGNTAILLRVTGHPEQAESHYQQALAIHRQLGSRRSEGAVLSNLGNLAMQRGDLDQAVARLQEALHLNRASGDRRLEAISLGALSNACASQGRYAEAMAHGRSALAIARQAGERRAEGTLAGSLGALHLDVGEPEAALPYLETALEIDRAIGERRFEGIVLRDLGRYHVRCGRHREARACFEQALAIHCEVRDRRSEALDRCELARLDLAEGHLVAAGAALAAGEAILRELEDHLELAILLCVRGKLELASGKPDAARVAQCEATRLARESGAGPNSVAAREISGLEQSLG